MNNPIDNNVANGIHSGATAPTESQIPSNAQPTQPAYLRDGLIHKKQAVYRLDGADIRWYYTISNHGQVQFYGSVTSILDKTLPTSPYLIKWIAEHGVQGANRLRDQKAEYGTLMHLVIADYLQNEVYNLNMMHFIVQHYVREHRIQYDTSWWAESLQKDLLSFDAFCKEYNVKPLAVEMVCAAPSLGYAGCIDLVCEMTIQEKGFVGEFYKSGPQKGEPKESKFDKTIKAIVDFKSGKHQFYENNEIQANMYMNLWNNCYPEAKVDRCFNWRPSEWEGTEPTYSVKDQTRVKSCEKIPYLLKLFAIDIPPSPKPSLVMTGTINLNGQFDGVIRRKPAEEIALERTKSIFQDIGLGIAKAVASAPESIARSSQGVTFPQGGIIGTTTQLRQEQHREANSLPTVPESGNVLIVKDPAKKAKPETIEIVTPLSPENYLTPTEFEQVTTAADAAAVIDNPPIADNPPEAAKPQVQTFLPEDDDMNDEVIVPAPDVAPAAPAPKKPISPTLEKMKAELAGSNKPNGKLQTA